MLFSIFRPRISRYVLLLTQKLASRCKSVSSIAARLVDKQHRLRFRTLEREVSRYNKSKITLRPRIGDLLVYIHQSVDKKLDRVFVKPPATAASQADLCEAVVFHIVSALHSIEADLGMKAARKGMLGTKFEGHNTNGVEENLKDMLNEFTSHEKTAQLPKDDPRIAHIRHALSVFQSLPRNLYSFLDLVCWVRSVSAPSILEGCQALSTLTNIPAFVTSDILFRTPMRPEDLQLQLDVWSQFMADITAAYYSRTNHIKSIVDNLLFYCVVHDTSLLPLVLQGTLGHLTSTKGGFLFPFVDRNFLNRLLWVLAYDFARTSSHNQPVNLVVAAQETIVGYMKAVGEVQLNVEGHMGVVLAVHFISPSKAQRFFALAESRIGHFSQGLLSRQTACYNFTKTYLCDTPETLLETFNACAVHSFNSASLWLAFVTKLKHFDLMTVARSLKILEELVKHSDRVLITKDIVLVLVFPLSTLGSIQEFVRILASGSAGRQLATAHISVLTPKFLSILYGAPKSVVTADPIWGLRNSTTALELARHIYSSARKTPKLVGIMLSGEAALQPEKTYDLYNAEIKDRGLQPDEQCLMALIEAATSTKGSGVLMWGSLYAPQVAIREYKNYTTGQNRNSSRYCRPSDRLWQRYIAMLVQFDYVSELSTILQTWVEMEFHPAPETLMALLRALPWDFALRCIVHFDKLKKESVTGQLKGPSQWPWPAVEEVRRG